MSSCRFVTQELEEKISGGEDHYLIRGRKEEEYEEVSTVEFS